MTKSQKNSINTYTRQLRMYRGCTALRKINKPDNPLRPIVDYKVSVGYNADLGRFQLRNRNQRTILTAIPELGSESFGVNLVESESESFGVNLVESESESGSLEWNRNHLEWSCNRNHIEWNRNHH